MYANLGPGQIAERDPPSPNGVDVLYSHEYVAERMRERNLYGYCGNSPSNQTDPSGLEWVWPWDPDAVWWWPFGPSKPKPPPEPPIMPPGPPGITEFSGGLGCAGEALQADKQEAYYKNMMQKYPEEICPEEHRKWKRFYENCKRMREEARKKRAEKKK